MIFLDEKKVKKMFESAKKEPDLKSNEMIFRYRIFRKIIKHIEQNGKLSITDLYDLIFDKI